MSDLIERANGWLENRHIEDSVVNEERAATIITELIARVEALEDAARWRPIDEAPKDGTRVMGIDITASQKCSFPIYFDTELECWVVVGFEWTFKPTHWLPRPEPPKDGE